MYAIPKIIKESNQKLEHSSFRCPHRSLIAHHIIIMHPGYNCILYALKGRYLIAAKRETQTITSWLSPRGRVPTVAGRAAPPFPAIRAFNCFKRGSTSESNPHRWAQRSIVKGVRPTGRSPCQIVADSVDYHFRVPSAVLPVPTLSCFLTRS